MTILPGLVACLSFLNAGTDWPSFRGAFASGVSEGHPLPTQWDIDAGEGLRWRTEIPGLGHSSPVIVGDRIFVTTAEAEKEAILKIGLYGSGDPVADEGSQAFLVLCIDKHSGEILWEELAHEGVAKIRRHPKASHASSTPAADQERVIAFFGSEGLYCYDHDGALLWKKDFGVLDCGAPDVPDLQWGFASSPVLHEGKVYVQCDVQDQSFVAALDAETGEELWRTLRDEGPTWGSPAVVHSEQTAQLVLNGYRHIGGYDLESGEERWKLVGGGDVPVPTPVFSDGLIFITNAHGKLAPIYAIRPQAKGQLTMSDEDPFLAWSYPRRGNYMQTPLVYQGNLYCCSDGGVLACYEASTGRELSRQRIGDGTAGYSASLVAGDGKLYLTSEEGSVTVLGAGAALERLADNDLLDSCMATPAISEGALYFRTRHQLVAIGEDS